MTRFRGSAFAKMLIGNVGSFLIVSPLCLMAQGSLNPDTLVTNATQTPIEGVGHDYVHDLSETVNPQNGQVSIRIAGPAPHERGPNLPHYAYMYDTSGREALSFAPVLNNCSVQNSGMGPILCMSSVVGHGFSGYAINQFGYNALSYGISGPNPTLLNTLSAVNAAQSYKNPNVPAGVNAPVTYYCYYNAFNYFDSHGGLHSLNLHTLSSETPAGVGCPNLGYETDLFGGDSSVKADCQDANCYTVKAVTSSGLLTTTAGVEDTNGNSDDGTGRPMQYTFNTVQGHPQPPGSGQTSFLGLSTITLPGVSGTYTYNYSTFTRSSAVGLSASVDPYSTSGGCQANIAQGTQSTTFSDVSSLLLPNGQSYTFGYDGKWGLVNSITYPTGATVAYTWNVNSLAESYSASTPEIWANITLGGMTKNCYFKYDLPVVTKRVVCFDGKTPALEQDFAYSTAPGTNGFWATKKTTVTTTDLLRTGHPKTVTIYNYIPMFPPLVSTASNSTSIIPHESSVVYQDGSGHTLRTVIKVWAGVDLLGAECEVLENGMVSGKFYQYQQFSTGYVWSGGMSDQVTDLAEYDYGQGVTSACVQPPSTTPPARETKTQYATIPSSVLWQPALGATIPQTNDRPSVVQVYDHGTLLAETDIAYDQTAVSPVSPPAYNHDETNYSSSQVAGRGNATTITKKCFQTCSADSITAQYDETGQIVSVTDANGNTTKLSYQDNYSTGGTPPGNTNTYVTSITRPTTNGVTHQSSFAYNYTFGELTSATDENGQPTTYQYNDTWGRPTLVNTPDGGQTTLTYNDAPPSPSFTSSKLITSGLSLVTTTTMDGIGHPVLSQLTSDPSGTISTATVYDGWGRAYETYNPTRCSPATTNCGEATWGYTTYSYDAIGRMNSVLRPDGGYLLTTYAGRAAEVQDEGNGSSNVMRVSQTDALGRLISVCEVTSATQFGGGAPSACGQDIAAKGFITNYLYDALGNLTGVRQGSRSRSFTYDSLSRLLCAANPETGGSATCPNPDNGSYTAGTTRYGYDANGNVVSRVRPAPNQSSSSTTVSTTYLYDALNRLTSVTYSDSVTPSVARHYDTTLELGRGLNNTIGRLSAEYVTSPSGQLLSGKLFGYDPVGRVNDNSQCTPSSCPSSTLSVIIYSYDLLGDILTATNGQGTTLTSAYDGAARLTTLSSSLSDANHPATLFSSGTYNPFGSLSTGSLGTALNESFAYDCRGRVLAYASVVFPATPSLSIANTAGCTTQNALNRGTDEHIVLSTQNLLARYLRLPPTTNFAIGLRDPLRAVPPMSIPVEENR